MMWAILIDSVDYHHRQWYERDGNGDWQKITIGRAFGLFDQLAPGADHAELVKLFRYRDRDARARLK